MFRLRQPNHSHRTHLSRLRFHLAIARAFSTHGIEACCRLQAEAVNVSDGGLKTALKKTLEDYRAGKLPEVKEE